MKHAVIIIGRSETVDFPELGHQTVSARIDTGAKTSSVWASNIHESNGVLHFTLFDVDNRHFNGVEVHTRSFDKRTVASSNGHSQERYVVKLLVILNGRRIRASFSLANRSSQAYPVLIGRNVLRGKFLVDVREGTPDKQAEINRSKQLKNHLNRKEKA